MIRFDDMPPGPVKVVMSHEVENLTRSGWKLVFCYQDTLLMPCQETAPRPYPDPHNSYGVPTVGVTVSRPYTTTFYVLVEDEENALAQMTVQLAEATGREAQAQSEAKAWKDCTTNANKALDQEKERVKTLELTNKSVANERDTLRAANKKMEADLAKLRKAVGEIQYKEICPSETK